MLPVSLMCYFHLNDQTAKQSVASHKHTLPSALTSALAGPAWRMAHGALRPHSEVASPSKQFIEKNGHRPITVAPAATSDEVDD